MDQYQQKKQLESLLVGYFKQAYPKFPDGKLIVSESPDFLLALNNRYAIGIELTRLHPKSQKVHSDLELEQVKIEEELVEKTQYFFEEKNRLKCFVKVFFSESDKIKPERVLSISARIFRLILDNVRNFKETEFNQSLIRKDLPAGIDALLILSHPRVEYSVWERSNNLGISTDLLEDIRYSIRKKDEKLRLYLKQNLNEYWLLIIADKLFQGKPVKINNHILNSGFESEFEKVFILELLTGNVIVLI